MKGIFKYRDILPFIDLSIRIYLAYYLVDYGYAKLDGSMFNNASPKILVTPLNQVDLFHLTWYWFKRNIVYSWFIGICQLLAAVLLLIRPTVLAGALLSAIIFLNIFLIDVYCFPGCELAIRVFYYLLLSLSLFALRKEQVVAILAIAFQRRPSPAFSPVLKNVGIVILGLFACLIIEIVATSGIGFILWKVFHVR